MKFTNKSVQDVFVSKIIRYIKLNSINLLKVTYALF